MIRVGITGRRRRGKGAMSSVLRSLRPAVKEHNFADTLKLDAAQMLNWAIDRFGIPRPEFDLTGVEALNRPERRALLAPLWQWYGTEFCRAADPDYWVKRWGQENKYLHNVVVSDVRFPNEAEYLKGLGYTMVRVTGPQWGDDGRDDNHPSEAHTDTLPVDLEYENLGGLADIEWWVSRVLLPTVEETR